MGMNRACIGKTIGPVPVVRVGPPSSPVELLALALPVTSPLVFDPELGLEMMRLSLHALELVEEGARELSSVAEARATIVDVAPHALGELLVLEVAIQSGHASSWRARVELLARAPRLRAPKDTESEPRAPDTALRRISLLEPDVVMSTIHFSDPLFEDDELARAAGVSRALYAPLEMIDHVHLQLERRAEPRRVRRLTLQFHSVWLRREEAVLVAHGRESASWQIEVGAGQRKILSGAAELA